MSYNTIIAEIIGIDDKNIKFTGKFLKSKVIRGVEHTIVEAELTYDPSKCEHCKTKKDNYNIVKNGSQVTNILVGQFNSKPLMLRLKKQRFYCKHCCRIFMEQTPVVQKNCFISNKVKEYVDLELADNVSMKHIASTYSISSSTVQRVLRFNIFKINKNYLPKVLGIDEFHIVQLFTICIQKLRINIMEKFKTSINTVYAYKDSIVNVLDISYTNAVAKGNNIVNVKGSNVVKKFHLCQKHKISLSILMLVLL